MGICIFLGIMFLIVAILCIFMVFADDSDWIYIAIVAIGCCVLSFMGAAECHSEDALKQQECPSCNITIENYTINYCDNCGYEFHKACKGCGTRVGEDYQFCVKCGKEVD